MKDTRSKVEKFQIGIFQRMSPETKLNLSVELTKVAVELVKAGIKYRHPEFTIEEIEKEFKKILLTEEIFRKVYKQ